MTGRVADATIVRPATRVLRGRRLPAAPRGQASVTVVVPCYNYAHFLPAAVESALAQTAVDVEVVIVDDLSSDDSVAVARRLAAAEPRVRVIAHEVNRGPVATYNDGLVTATGDYVVLLSADDRLAPGSLGRACALMEEHPSVGLVYGFCPDYVEEPPAQLDVEASWTVFPGRWWLERMCLRGTNIIVNPEAVMRRSVFAELGGYDPDFPQTSDQDMWMRAAARADVGRVNGPFQAFYHQHGANMHVTDFKGVETEMRARLATFEHVLTGPASDLADAQQLLQTARRSVALDGVRLACSVLATGRRPGDPDPESLATIAQEAWPTVTATAAWRRYERWTRSAPPSALGRAHRAARYAVIALRWRRWRRFGT